MHWSDFFRRYTYRFRTDTKKAPAGARADLAHSATSKVICTSSPKGRLSHKIQHTSVIMINNSDSSTILSSNLRTGQEIRIFYCKFWAEQHIISYSHFLIHQSQLMNLDMALIQLHHHLK